jgi:hypothetical protein
MESWIELSKILDTPDELKDAANIYYKCINLNGIESLKSPSLKYSLYNLHWLDDISKESKESFDFDCKYSGKLAKKYDTIIDDTVKGIYVNSSEEVIFSRIKYYIKCEKYFLIYNEIIKQLLSFL